MKDINITDAVFAVAERSPHSVAIIDSETIISFRTLCHGVSLAAGRFQQAGWKADDIVGISLHGSQALHLVVSLALARLGITQVALPSGDPAPLVCSRVKSLGVRALVSDHALAAESGVATVAPDPGWMVELPSAAAASDVRVAGGDRLWMIAESSGTTSEPKLIGVSHAMEELQGRRQAPLFAHRPGERFLNLSGVRFLIGIKRAIRCLSDGGTLAIASADINARQLLNWIDRHNIRYISCVPLHLHQLLREIHTDCPRLPSLRILRCSSAALPATTLHEVHRRISPNVYVGYGLSEGSSLTTATPDMLAEQPDTVGRPYDGIELEIVDGRDRPLPAGTAGLVRARGAGIQSAYLRASAQDQARTFRNGWCYPGDIGVKNEAGLLFIKGRADDVMNYDGILISPGEIESVLRQHPAVAEAAAFPLPSPDSQAVPAAAVVLSQSLHLDELMRFCTERLGIRAPRLLFQFKEIPKNPMGKVLRRRLTEVALDRLKEKARS